MNTPKKFSIGELSKKTGISIRNLRYYDEIGLLAPEKHPTSGHRVYNYDHILTLQKIPSLKFLGYRLNDINDLLHQSSFSVDLNKTLILHLQALKEEKEQIEKSMDGIQRVISLLEEEKEVESNLLFSLMNNLEMAHTQKEWMERHNLTDVVDELTNLTEEDRQSIDILSLEIVNDVKRLYGRSFDAAEVQDMIASYMKTVYSILVDDVVQKLNNIDVKDQELQDLENMTLSPFTKEEQKWLIQAIDYYKEQSER